MAEQLRHDAPKPLALLEEIRGPIEAHPETECLPAIWWQVTGRRRTTSLAAFLDSRHPQDAGMG